MFIIIKQNQRMKLTNFFYVKSNENIWKIKEKFIWSINKANLKKRSLTYEKV